MSALLALLQNLVETKSYMNMAEMWGTPSFHGTPTHGTEILPWVPRCWKYWDSWGSGFMVRNKPRRSEFTAPPPCTEHSPPKVGMSDAHHWPHLIPGATAQILLSGPKVIEQNSKSLPMKWTSYARLWRPPDPRTWTASLETDAELQPG